MTTDGNSERIEALEHRITELETERDRWRSLLVEVVGAAVAERMWEGLSQ